MKPRGTSGSSPGYFVYELAVVQLPEGTSGRLIGGQLMANNEKWGTRVGLVLAMAGNAVGLGNFLRFPAQAAQNGGGAFLIPYLVCFVLVGIPLLWVEWAIGRHGGQYGHHSTPGMFHVLGRHRWLKHVGVFGLFTSLGVNAYYVYLESWTLAYVWHSLAGTFSWTNPPDFFNTYLGNDTGGVWAVPTEALFWFLVTLGLNLWILSRGIAKGIETVAKIGLPLLIVFAVILVLRGLTLHPGYEGVIESPLAGLNFVWEPKLTGIGDPSVWLAAAGQIFFTLSLGMGSIHCYASYVEARGDIALNAASAGWLNEFIEVVLGGALIIPIAAAYLGLEAVRTATHGGSGFSLGFLTLPTLFQNWGWFAPLAGAMWFGLLFLAGITSSLAMGQPVVAFLEDEVGLRKSHAVSTLGFLLLLLSSVCIVLYPSGAFDEFDYWTGTFALVAFALAEAVVFSFVFGIEKGWNEITRGAELQVHPIFRFVIHYVTPLLLLLIFGSALVEPSHSWSEAIHGLFTGAGWDFSGSSVLGKILHKADADYRWFDSDGNPTVSMVKDGVRILLTGLFILLMFAVSRKWRRGARSDD